MKGFLHFIRTQGVVGLAVGFTIGTAAQSLVSSLSADLVSPTIGLATTKIGNLATASSTVAGQTFAWGHFLTTVINLILVAIIVYVAVVVLHTNRLDEQKDAQK